VTRENKLALIIGFTLILMVGVLVSDHLSRAREAQLDPASDPMQTMSNGQQAFSGTLLSDAIVAAQEHARNAEPPVATQVSGAAPATGVPSQPEMAPAVIRQGEDAAPNTSVSLNQGLDTLNQAADRVLGRLEESARRPMFQEAAGSGTTRIQSPARTIAAVPRDTGARTPTYTVRENDSLYKIAAKVLGDGNRWREIQRVNADSVGEDGAVRVGQTLRLPGLVVSTPAVREPGSGGGSSATYTVRSGDTLGEIASKVLGSSRRADDIVRANRDQINDPNEIRVGMVLKIPAR